MQLLINNTPFTCQAPIMLGDVPALLNLPGDTLALAVNQSIVTRSQWPDYSLHDGDQIDAFSLVAGG